MIAFFPEPLRDELLYSTCARFRAALGLGFPGAHSALFGAPHPVAVVDLPGRIGVLVRRLPPGAVYTTRRLIAAHTTLPYYRPFKPAADVARAAAVMEADSPGVVTGLLGVRSSSIGTPERLQYCGACVRADRHRHGVAYWRRTHQMPGVFICAIHRTPLTASTVFRTPRRVRSAFYALEDVLDARVDAMPGADATAGSHGTPEAAAEHSDVPGGAGTPTITKYGVLPSAVDVQAWRPHLIRIARDTAWLLASDVDGPGLPGLRARYLEALHGPEFRRGQLVRVPDLRAAVRAHYGDRLLAALHCTLGDSDGADDWLARTVRRVRGALHPLQHLLLIHFLGHTAESFLASRLMDTGTSQAALKTTAPRAGRRSAADPSADRPPPPAGDHPQQVRERIRGQKLGPTTAEWDDELRRLIEHTTVPQTHIARRLGIAAKSLKRHARRLGVWRVTWCECGRLRPGFRTQAAFAARRARERSAYLAYLREHPGARRSDAVRDLKCTVTWLRRRDAAWLREHQPARCTPVPTRARVDWAARDRLWRAAAEAGVAELRARRPSPRITQNAVRRIMGATYNYGRLGATTAKAPLTFQYLRAIAESRDAFARRRLALAADECRRDGASPSAFALTCRAGLGSNPSPALRAEVEALAGELRAAVA